MPLLDYITIGNVVNTVVLAGSLLYAGIVLVDSPVLDEGWKQDGFCIHNRHVHYWSSFDTCLYIDVIFSIILMLMWLHWKDKPNMTRASELVPMVIMSTLGHGAAHGAMAHEKFRITNSTPVGDVDDGSTAAASSNVFGGDDNYLVTAPAWQIVAFVALFWFPLLKASLNKVPSHIVALVAVIVTYIHGMMPNQFSFGYVQTVVSIAFNTSQLLLPAKEKACREYATLAATAAIPVIVAWNEALFCDAYFREAGGHMLYDASIILTFLVYYTDAYYFNVVSSTAMIMKTTTTITSPLKSTNKQKSS